MWIERRFYTESQLITVQPNEELNGIVIEVTEIEEPKTSSRLYLTYKEALVVAKQLKEFTQQATNEEF